MDFSVRGGKKCVGKSCSRGHLEESGFAKGGGVELESLFGSYPNKRQPSEEEYNLSGLIACVCLL
ncbi:hypothetical protein MtrunA17_Chr5g0440431 [Medicago truncatula]|uniref:Uncharacterized protein n=1 Tax=Medicago truncatula TaxID=3880 RepID=A0A396HXY3_MEDTR|nr:hypothetical protein MtrunA17_Chr5g0440431 [Medicago truncatula]